MLLADYENLIVYQVDNTHFEPIGQVNQLISVNWGKKYSSYYEFEISVLASQENIKLLTKGNIIWGQGKEAGIIDIVSVNRDENGKVAMKVKGRTLECLLERRAIFNTMIFKNKSIAKIMEEMVDDNFVLPLNYKRVLPYLVCEHLEEDATSVITMQKTGGDVYSALCEMNKKLNENVGFEVEFVPDEQKIKFKVFVPDNHTIESQNPVIFSDSFDNIITDEYYENVRNHKNFAYIAGEVDEYGQRILTTQGEDTTGYERKELYVDAKDLQRENGDNVLTYEEYIEMLNARGGEKLGTLQPVETFDANLQINESQQYIYGEDYNVGDMVTVQDNEMGLSVNARVSGLQEKITEDKLETKIVLGYELPTLSERLKSLL